MNHTRTRRAVAGSAVLSLLGGLLTLVLLQPAQASHGTRTLQVVPEYQEDEVGSTLTLRAELSSAVTAGEPVRIAFEVEGGPVDPDGGANYNTADRFCTISSGDSCSISFTGGSAGSSIVRAWIDHDQKDLADADSQFEADTAEGRLSSAAPAGDSADCRFTESDEASPTDCLSPTVAAGDTAEPDDTDVVELAFTGGTKRLDCVDSNPVNGTDHEVNPKSANESYTCTAVGPDGAPLEGAAIDGENLNGPNDPDNASATPADYDTTVTTQNFNRCRTGADGKCTMVISAAEGDVGSANATICFWIDEENQNEDTAFTLGGPVEDGGDCGEAVDANDGDPTDTVSIGWRSTAPTASLVNTTPEEQSGPTGSTFNLTATVYDQFGDSFKGGAIVKSELYTGAPGDTDGTTPDTPDRSCSPATGADTCVLSFTASTSGRAPVCTWVGLSPAMAGSGASATCGGEGLADGPAVNGHDLAFLVYFASATTPTSQPTAEEIARTQGYTLVGADGGIFTYGTAQFHGSTGDLRLNRPIIGMASKKGGTGYWLVASDGGIFSFGDAEFFGSMGDQRLNAPVLGMEATPSGKGYFLFAADGGIFTFGDAVFKGSTGDQRLNQPVVGMAVTEKGDGYWLVARDGGIFSFNAPFHGSTGDIRLNEPIFDMGSRPGDGGYWLVARDGGIFTFGDAEFYNSAVGATSAQVIGLGVTPTGKGYWIADARGAVFPFGDARFLGDRRSEANNATTVGFATVPKA